MKAFWVSLRGTLRSSGEGRDGDKLNLLIVFHWIVTVFSLFYSLVSWWINFHPGMIIMAANAVLLLLNLAYLKHSGRFQLATHTFLLTNCLVAVLGSTWFSGGLFSPVVSWFGLAPMAATLLLGFNRATFVWLCIAMACLVGVGWTSYTGWGAPVLYDARFNAFFAFVSLLGNMLLLFFLTQIFESVKNHALTESDARNRELKEAIKRLNEIRNQLVQQEKLASLGSLVAGVAHELNTPIGNALTTATTLQDAAEELQRHVERGDLRKSYLLDYVSNSIAMHALITRSCERAATLISSFKRVAVDQTSEQRRPFDVRALIEDNVNTLMPSFKTSNVLLEVDVPPHIECDSYPGPLGQVISNLLQNALMHAFGEREECEVRISASKEFDRVRIVVADNGVGMDAQTLPRIFDPFFTTRLGQGGSGLGLAVSQNIMVAVLGGTITVSSQPGSGSRFTLTFPLHAPVRDEHTPVSAFMSL
jgi:signal transduction histidine kinase